MFGHDAFRTTDLRVSRQDMSLPRWLLRVKPGYPTPLDSFGRDQPG